MRIVEIEVKKLFGIFDHRIPLHTADRITIIHGPNGFGKTIMLRMLRGLFSGRYEELQIIPFHQLSVHFDNGTRVQAEKEIWGDQPERQENGVSISFHNGNLSDSCTRSFIPATRQKPEQLYNIDYLDHLDLNQLYLGYLRQDHLDDPLQEAVNSAVIQIHRPFQCGKPEPDEATEKEPSWWSQILRDIHVKIIYEQRLMKHRSTTRSGELAMVLAIDEYATELANNLREKSEAFASLAQSLDQTFPTRLLKRLKGENPSEMELSRRLSELRQQRRRLRDVGILDEQEEMPILPTDSLDEQARDVLAIYVEDAETKLGVFEDLANRLELFKRIINDRFLHKHIRISRSDGFVFTTDSGRPLPLRALSSGEQQEVILLYQLLFQVEPDSLVLIDEPEISLHVAWQKKFLEDLEKITKLASFDVLIATHSPQIIHKRWDLTVELKGPEVAAASLP